MLVMIFVNDLAGVKGLPWWNYHMPAHANGMTYVDMVFPVFLFIVGMSIPLAVEHRLAKDDSLPKLWVHVILRSVSLLILGLALANASKVDPELTGLTGNQWKVLFLAGAVLFWNIYPRSQEHQLLYKILKYSGLILMAVMSLIFKRTSDGQVAWFDFSYWEILGLIGWAYLSVCILYITTRKWHWAPIAWLIILSVLNILSKLNYVNFLDLPVYLWPFGTGALASVTMAGVVASMIFLDKRFVTTLKQQINWALSYAIALFAAGWFLTPLGISKIRATPTWCLYCAAISTLIFLALYWLCDVKQVTGWAAFLKPAGSNTLLTYLLPYFFYAILGSVYFAIPMKYGWPGAIRSLAFAGLILAIAGALTKCKVRMQL